MMFVQRYWLLNWSPKPESFGILSIKKNFNFQNLICQILPSSAREQIVYYGKKHRDSREEINLIPHERLLESFYSISASFERMTLSLLF